MGFSFSNCADGHGIEIGKLTFVRGMQRKLTSCQLRILACSAHGSYNA